MKWYSLMLKMARQYAHDQTNKLLNVRYIEMVKLYIPCRSIGRGLDISLGILCDCCVIAVTFITG